MRAYKIKIELRDSNPLIWRKVIITEGTTFKKLHESIQFSMGWMDCHMYDFNFSEEKLRITCDKEAVSGYEFYSKEESEKIRFCDCIKDIIETKIIDSDEIKIDDCAITCKGCEYVYDFCDCWAHDITLEEILEVDEYRYPICVEGEGACPPEEIGGINEYSEFLEIINNNEHPRYEEMKKWADMKHYKSVFNIEEANRVMSNKFQLKKYEELEYQY